MTERDPATGDSVRPAPADAGLSERTAAALAQLDSEPLSAHAEIYERIHGELHGALADIDDA